MSIRSRHSRRALAIQRSAIAFARGLRGGILSAWMPARYVRDRLPGLEPAGLAAETCLCTMTLGEDFVLDREGPVVVGGGCSGHAFMFAPLRGEMLADLALGTRRSLIVLYRLR
jgi:glycine/D-amino acid oxidase-like deaminating enzyme